MIKLEGEAATRKLLNIVQFDGDGLICAIAQDYQSKEVLMVAWMNRAALEETLHSGVVVYYSRSRQVLWRKGESSGQTQKLVDIRIDCDKDALLLSILQTGVACHTGRRSCFSWAPTSDGTWQAVESVIIDPDILYGGDK